MTPTMYMHHLILNDKAKYQEKQILQNRLLYHFSLFFYLRPSKVRRLASSLAVMRSLRAEC